MDAFLFVIETLLLVNPILIVHSVEASTTATIITTVIQARDDRELFPFVIGVILPSLAFRCARNCWTGTMTVPRGIPHQVGRFFY